MAEVLVSRAAYNHAVCRPSLLRIYNQELVSKPIQAYIVFAIGVNFPYESGGGEVRVFLLLTVQRRPII